MATVSVNDSTEYGVEDILAHRVKKSVTGDFVTQFLVKWKVDGSETWEPFKNVGHLPILMKKFQAVSRKKLLESEEGKSLSQQALAAWGNFPVLRKEVSSHLKLPFEHIPLGNETVVDIIREELRNGKMFWVMEFKDDGGGIRLVRDFVVQYYFPESAAYFELLTRERVKKSAMKMKAMSEKS